MPSKVLLLFLTTFLLVQSSFGKAVTTTVKPDLSDEQEIFSFKLLVYIVAEHSQLADSFLNNGKKLFQDVIADVSAQDNKNEEITARLDEYSKLVGKIEKLQTKNLEDSSEDSSFIDKFQLMVDLSDMLVESDVPSIKSPTAVDKLFYESLKKNGLDNLEHQFKDEFEKFAKGFVETAERILNSATIEQWPEKTKMQDLLKNFNTENDLEKKIVLFEKIFDILK